MKRSYWKDVSKNMSDDEIKIRVQGSEQMIPSFWKRIVLREAKKRGLR